MRRRIAAAFAAVALLSTACSSEPEPFAGFVRTPTPSVAEVSLPAVDPDHAGDFSFVADDGGLLVVYFGYTSCPDVCPTTLADLSAALNRMEVDTSGVDVAMVTIDPAVDTDEVVTAYVQSFVPGSVAVRTDDDTALRAAATAFGADYGTFENDEGEVEVFHTGLLYLIDDRGDLLLSWPFGTTADAMASDLTRVIEGEEVTAA
ncbi:MAG: SCO family protein [Acidimicrobiales bacterium]